MAKELPYFKFEPAEYLTKDISFCSLSAQGLFINICSYYWQRGCDLTKEQLLRRLNYEKELIELISEGVIDLKGENITIKFLDLQLSEFDGISRKNSENGKKGGRPKNPIETQLKPKPNPIETQIKAIREDKKKEEKRKEDKSIENIEGRKLKFASTLEPYISIYGREFLNDFYSYWVEPNKSNTKFRQELEKTWDLHRRLETWAKNEKNFKKQENGKQNTNNSGGNYSDEFMRKIASGLQS